MLHQTMQLAQARAETTANQKMQYQTYDMLAQRAGLKSNMVMSVDQGQDFAPIDYGINTAPLVQTPFRASDHTQGNWFMQFLNSGAASMLGQGIGNMFGAGGAGGGGTRVAQTFAVKPPSNIQQFLLK